MYSINHLSYATQAGLDIYGYLTNSYNNIIMLGHLDTLLKSKLTLLLRNNDCASNSSLAAGSSTLKNVVIILSSITTISTIINPYINVSISNDRMADMTSFAGTTVICLKKPLYIVLL